ncbi:MAG TPA: hypothetical protein VIH35_09435 [Kiritimatiellia bacterium]|jgi:hypothetical protein
MKWNLTGMLLLVLYVNILPFACRLLHGVEWMVNYLPEGVGGILFFAAVNTLAAGPLLPVWWLRKVIPVTWYLTLATVTAALVWLHHDYDLASDAQAAIGLLFFPVLAAAAGSGVLVIAGPIEGLMRKRAARNAAQAPSL